MVSGDIKVAMMVSHGIRVTKAIAKCVLSNSNCRRQRICQVTVVMSIMREKGKFSSSFVVVLPSPL